MVNKKIISRYNEDVSWIDFDDTIIFNKGEHLKSNIETINLPNAGREAQTWTYYIINNYQNLPDICFFIQANPFDHSEDIKKRLLVDYKYPTPLTYRYTKLWPGKEKTKYDLCFEVNNLKVRMGNINYFGHKNFQATQSWFANCWNEIFKCKVPSNYYYGYGAMWAVPKKFILNRSLNFWNNINELLLKSTNEAYQSTIDAWAMEALWAAVFSSPDVYPSIK